MEVTPTKPATELASISASALQATQFKDRAAREAQSDVRNQVVYFSPVVKINPETQTAVMVYRDSETGKVKNEYPKKSAQAYQAAQETAPKEVVSETAATENSESVNQDA